MIKIYTDGGCNQIKKNGGWSFIILEDDEEIFRDSGSQSNTTNNQCEMLAVIKSIQAIEEEKIVYEGGIKLYSDSAYIVNAFLDNWIIKWEKNGWKTSVGNDVANKLLWKLMIGLKNKYNVEFNHIKRCSDLYARQVNKMAQKKVEN